MIEPTDEMVEALLDADVDRPRDQVARILAIVERDNVVSPRSTLCEAIHPQGTYVCEFPAGHAGRHLTWSGPIIPWESS